jgi:tetratricopeptide (TPR) repeat protein
LDEGYKHAQTAVTLSPDDSMSRSMLGMSFLLRRKYEEAGFQLERAVSINPNDTWAAHFMGLYLDMIGRPIEAISWLQKAIRLDPLSHQVYRETLGYALYSLERFQEALAEFRSLEHKQFWIHACLAACYVQLDRSDDARAEAEAYFEDIPSTSHAGDAEGYAIDQEARLRSTKMYLETYQHDADRDRWLNAIRKAGIPV